MFLLFIILLLVSIGYAALSTTLKINGTAKIAKNTWSIYWDRDTISKTSGSKGNTTPTVTDGDDGSVNTKLNWSVNFELPGEFYEFTIDAVNDGTIDAMVSDIKSTLPNNLPSYIKYSVTYADGVPIAKNQKFDKKSSHKYKVRVDFLDTITPEELNLIPEGGNSYNFEYMVTYSQATSDAYQKATTFDNDTWDIIKKNVTAAPGSYPVGATKTIEMDLDDDGNPETYTLRVANNSRPDVCKGENFSQTACGFVVEFADVIDEYRINYYDNNNVTGSGGTGSWKYCDMRAYLNNGIYPYLNVDHTVDGLYGHLPDELKNKIIPTKVITGHNIVDTENFETEDNLYLLSSVEIWGSRAPSSTVYYETLSESETRQLDYYRINKVTLTNYSAVIKNYKNRGPSMWWLRSVQADTGWWNFLYADNTGGLNRGPAGNGGVSPAFRLS